MAWRERSGCWTQTKSFQSSATSSWGQECSTYTRISSCWTTSPPAVRWSPSSATTSQLWTAQSSNWRMITGIGLNRQAKNYEWSHFLTILPNLFALYNLTLKLTQLCTRATRETIMNHFHPLKNRTHCSLRTSLMNAIRSKYHTSILISTPKS